MTLEVAIDKIKRFHEKYKIVPNLTQFEKECGSTSWLRECGYTWNMLLEQAGLEPVYRQPKEIIDEIEKELSKKYEVQNVARTNLQAGYTFLINGKRIAFRYSDIMSDGFYKFKNRTECDYLLCVGSEGDIYFMPNVPVKLISINTSGRSKYGKYKINKYSDIEL
jgi:hypothetical protein